MFFINGPNEPTDFFQGVVRSMTAAEKYDVVYDDYDEEEIGEAEFEILQDESQGPSCCTSTGIKMPNAVDLSGVIRGMISYAAMMSKRSKVNAKLSAYYDPDPMSLDVCKKSNNWEYPKQGNSWKQAIMNKIDNLKKFDVFQVKILLCRVSLDKDFSDRDRISY